MTLLVSDANVLLDLEVGGLLEHLFDQAFDCVVPDVLYYEELEEQHAHLLNLGLGIRELDGEGVALVGTLVDRHRSVSRNDCLALALALTEGVPLLTGDKPLRNAAQSEEVAVVGSIWVIDELVLSGSIRLGQAHQAYEIMRRAQRRLPWEVALGHLEAIEAGTFIPRNPFSRT